jgi:hypothetical protein
MRRGTSYRRTWCHRMHARTHTHQAIVIWAWTPRAGKEIVRHVMPRAVATRQRKASHHKIGTMRTRVLLGGAHLFLQSLALRTVFAILLCCSQPSQCDGDIIQRQRTTAKARSMSVKRCLKRCRDLAAPTTCCRSVLSERVVGAVVCAQVDRGSERTKAKEVIIATVIALHT